MFRAAVVVILLLSASARADVGGTFEAGLGVALVHQTPEVGDANTKLGAAWPAIAGGVKRGRLGVTARFSMIILAERTYLFLGPSLQWWATDRVFVAAGAGLGLIDLDEPTPNREVAYETFGLSLRLGLNLRPGRRHLATVSVELTPGIYPRELAAGVAVVGGYQYW